MDDSSQTMYICRDLNGVLASALGDLSVVERLMLMLPSVLSRTDQLVVESSSQLGTNLQ